MEVDINSTDYVQYMLQYLQCLGQGLRRILSYLLAVSIISPIHACMLCHQFKVLSQRYMCQGVCTVFYNFLICMEEIIIVNLLIVFITVYHCTPPCINVIKSRKS